MRRQRCIQLLGVVLAASMIPLRASAQQAPASIPGNGFGFGALLGWTSISGDYGDLMTDGIPAQGTVWYQTGGVRAAVNINVASYNVVEPFQTQHISQVEVAASGQWQFNRRNRLQPFAGLSAGMIRLRPAGAFFDPVPPPPDVLPNENTTPQRSGFVGGVFGGLEYWIDRHIAAHASVGYRAFSTKTIDVPLLGLTGLESGGAFDLRFGVEWTL